MGEIKRRRSTIADKNKKVKNLSFAGDEGYEALDVLESNNHPLGNSGMVVDLLRIYGKYKESLGIESDEDVLNMLKVKFKLNR